MFNLFADKVLTLLKSVICNCCHFKKPFIIQVIMATDKICILGLLSYL